MAQAEVIKEFLVSLGFKTDQKSLKDFTTNVGNATAGVVKLVAAIQGAALAVGAGVMAMASNLERLYNTSLRTKTAASNIRALEAAAQSLGANAGDVTSSLDGLARFMRETPMPEGYLKSLGVETRDANGQLKDTGELMIELSRILKNKDYWAAKPIADLLNINESTLLAMQSGQFEDSIRKYQEIYKNSGFDKATDDAKAFMNQLKELGAYFDIFIAKIGEKLFAKLGIELSKFSDWFAQHGDEIAEKIASVIELLLELAGIVFPALIWLADKLIALDKMTDGWSTKLLVLIGVLNMFGGAAIIGGILNLAGSFVTMATSIGGATAAAGGLVAALGKVAAVGAVGYAAHKAIEAADPNDALGSWIDENVPGASAVDNFASKFGLGRSYEEQKRVREALKAKEDAAKKGSAKPAAPAPVASPTLPAPAAPAPAAPAPKGSPAKPGPQSSLADPMKFFMGMGWTKEQAAGIVANLQRESSMNPKAVGDNGQAYGIAQWHPDRQREFFKTFGKDIRQSTMQEQLAFVQYELTQGAEKRAGNMLRAATNAKQAGEIVSKYYERPRDKDKEAAMRGDQAVQIAQTTNITVTGATDPQATAKAIGREQSIVNQNMARNMSGAVN